MNNSKVNLIGISGKIGSGKDTIANIIRYLILSKENPDYIKILSFGDFMELPEFNKRISSQDWEIKKFAYKIKDIVCLLINCTREDLENEVFKNLELGEEWWFYRFRQAIASATLDSRMQPVWQEYLVPYTGEKLKDNNGIYHPILKLTPRKLLQLIGTECGRNLIHPNIWVNSLFSEYRPIDQTYKYSSKPYNTGEFVPDKFIYPNWIITDLRFLNEATSIISRRGILIRIDMNLMFHTWCNIYGFIINNVRYISGRYSRIEFLKLLINIDSSRKDWCLREISKHQHESETALDNYDKFKYKIDNNGSIEELTAKVRIILEKENIL